MAKEQAKRKQGQQKKKSRFSQEQYDIIKRCSEAKDMTEWNMWRKENLHEDVCLERANLEQFYLKGALLNSDRVRFIINGKPTSMDGQVYLSGTSFADANLEDANLELGHLEGAFLDSANLKRAKLFNTSLEGASLEYVCLEGADLTRAFLQRATFCGSKVDSSTVIWGSKVDKRTDFREVALEYAKVDPSIKVLLEHNIRRMNWKGWFDGDRYKPTKTWKETSYIIFKNVLRTYIVAPIRVFWMISNYGLSTLRIIFTFFLLATLFGLVYWLHPDYIVVYEQVGNIRGFIHALYFSVVTMTTLGFGDIAANPESVRGQVLLMLQVILGYVLLGALVTRFSVIFRSSGPAGRFTKVDKETRQLLKELKKRYTENRKRGNNIF